MSGAQEIIQDAMPTPLFGSPPYHVEHFHIGSCVCRADGFNCLSFKSKPGAKFTAPDVAQAICDDWNREPHEPPRPHTQRPPRASTGL